MNELVSVIIRTLNEDRYLEELLQAIRSQECPGFSVEIVLVDSGSTDRTLEIAREYDCRITHIEKSRFTFGRSLNVGCRFAAGSILVFISGHCIPCDSSWLRELVAGIYEGCDYVYGRQVGRDTTKFSERQLFAKYFPEESKIPQVGFFCNNANSAIRRDTWERFRFNEELPGCEDMYLARLILEKGGSIGYCAKAPVYHIHDEDWKSVKTRYEREAYALHRILPEISISYPEMIMYIAVGIIKDFKAAIGLGVFWREASSIVRFRIMQYTGAFKGNRIQRQVSEVAKTKYFYPRASEMFVTHRQRDIRQNSEDNG